MYIAILWRGYIIWTVTICNETLSIERCIRSCICRCRASSLEKSPCKHIVLIVQHMSIIKKLLKTYVLIHKVPTAKWPNFDGYNANKIRKNTHGNYLWTNRVPFVLVHSYSFIYFNFYFLVYGILDYSVTQTLLLRLSLILSHFPSITARFYRFFIRLPILKVIFFLYIGSFS